jgi:hypothetical protein
MSENSGLLYATDVVIGDESSGIWHFGSIYPATGAFTAINDQAGSSNWQGLTFVPATDLFYATNVSATGGTLQRDHRRRDPRGLKWRDPL